MDPIRIFIARDPHTRQAFVADQALFDSLGMDDAAIRTAFGDSGRWHKVELYEPTHGRQEQAKRESLVPDSEQGFRLDPTRLPAARARVMIREWDLTNREGEPLPLPADVGALDAVIVNALDAAILERMYPSVFAHGGFQAFLQASKPPRPGSEATTETTPA